MSWYQSGFSQRSRTTRRYILRLIARNCLLYYGVLLGKFEILRADCQEGQLVLSACAEAAVHRENFFFIREASALLLSLPLIESGPTILSRMPPLLKVN